MRRTAPSAIRLLLAVGLALGAARGVSAEPPADEAAVVEARRRAARLPPSDTDRNPMDASNTGDVAVENLGRHYVEKGDRSRFKPLIAGSPPPRDSRAPEGLRDGLPGHDPP